jgi:moderate conductance mechanosensitive channel
MATYDREKIGAVTTMISVAERPWASMRALSTSIAAIFLSAVLLSGAAAAPHGSAANGSSGHEAATPPEIAEFMALLANPKIQKWLVEQHPAEASQKPKPKEETVSHYIRSRVAAIREHLIALGVALPELPNQFEQAVGLLQAEIPTRGTVLLLVVVFAAFGFGVEWLCRKATQKTRHRLDGLPMETVDARLRLVAARLAFAFGAVVAFALGSLGPFLALDWPPLLSQIVLGYLVALLVTRTAAVVSRFLLAPDAEHFRIVPTDTVAARFWSRRLTAFVGWLAFGLATVDVLTDLGFSLAGRELVAYVLGLGLVVIALNAVWRRPAAPDQDVEGPLPRDASPRPRRTEYIAVDRHCAAVGALGSESHAELLARPGHYYPAAGQ